MLRLHDALDRLVSEIGVFGKCAHAEVDSADGRGGFGVLIDPGIHRPPDVIEEVFVRRPDRAPYEWPVDHERALVPLEQVHRRVLVRGRQARARQALLADLRNDLRRLAALLRIEPELDLIGLIRTGGNDLAAGRSAVGCDPYLARFLY